MSELIITGKEKLIGVPDEIFEFEGFEFSRRDFEQNPMLMLGIVISADPTEGQRKMLELSGIVVVDKNGKQFFPREKSDDS